MTTEQMLIVGLAALALLVLVLVVLLAYLAGRLRARAAAGVPVTTPGAPIPNADALLPVVADLRDQFTGLRATIQTLQSASAAQEARRGLEDQSWEAIQRVERTLATLGQIPSQQQSLHDALGGALRDIAAIKELQAEHRQRWMREDAAFTSLQRLSAVMLGSARAGAAGERLVQEALASLPPQWRVTNHTVAGKPVEFAIHLPDGYILPIDSKVVAQADLDALEQTETEADRRSREQAIQGKVRQRAAEVRQYVDQRTPGFAIVAIPDAAYRLCGPILSRAYQEHHALLVPYSLLGPFVLMVYEQHQRAGLDLDSARIAHALADAQAHIEAALRELDARLSDALTRLTNGHNVLRHELADAAQGLSLLRAIGTRDPAPVRES